MYLYLELCESLTQFKTLRLGKWNKKTKKFDLKFWIFEFKDLETIILYDDPVTSGVEEE